MPILIWPFLAELYVRRQSVEYLCWYANGPEIFENVRRAFRKFHAEFSSWTPRRIFVFARHVMQITSVFCSMAAQKYANAFPTPLLGPWLYANALPTPLLGPWLYANGRW